MTRKSTTLRWEKPLAILLFSGLLAVLVLIRTDPNPSTGLDPSYIMGLAAKFQQGEISGRDFIFNYGPLVQVVTVIGTTLNSSGSPYDGLPMIFFCFFLLNIALLAVLLASIRPLGARFVLFLFVAVALLNNVPFDVLGFRGLTTILGAVLLSHAMSAPGKRARLFLGGAVGGIALVSQLITLELGPYLIAVAGVVLVAYAICARFPGILRGVELLPPQSYLQLLGTVLGTYVLGNVVLSLLFKLSSSNYESLFDYQKYALELIRGFTTTMSSPWSLTWFPSLGLFLIVGYNLAYILGNLRRFRPSDGTLLASLLVTSLVLSKQATIRSDLGHVLMGLFPSVLLFLFLGHDWLRSGRVSLLWAALLIVLFAIWPTVNFDALAQLRAVIEGKFSLRLKLEQITSVKTPPDTFLPTGLAEAPQEPFAPMVSFPYDDYIPIGLHRRLVAPVLQAYAAHTESLQQKYVAMLEREPASLEVVYGLDVAAVAAIDRVQHATRVPVIFDYLVRHFELESTQGYGTGYYLLRRRERPIELNTTVLGFTSGHWNGSEVDLKLDQPANCGLVRLRVEIGYPPTTALGRPDPLQVTFLSGGALAHQSNLVAMESGKEFSTFFSLIDPLAFYQYFGNAGYPEKPWDELQVTLDTSGILGVSPNRVEISQVECVEFP